MLEQCEKNTQRVCSLSKLSSWSGSSRPVCDLVARIRQQSAARTFVDAVAYAPHRVCDLRDLGVDGYAFSLYKVFGPHQSLLYIKRDLHADLAPQCHYFNTGYASKMFNPTGPQHAQVAACAGVIDYFDALIANAGGDGNRSRRAQLDSLFDAIGQHEADISSPILDCLDQHPKTRLLGKTHCRDNDRAPTIAFKPLDKSAWDVAAALQQAGVGAENGHFYAHRLLGDLGIEQEDGVVRISLVHYNSSDDTRRIVNALDAVL